MRWVLFSGLLSAALSNAPDTPAAQAADPLTRFRALPADSVEARRALVLESPAVFAHAVDSLLAAGGDPALLGEAARAHLAATGDSLLVWDAAFVPALDAEARRAWWRAVMLDEEGLALRKGDPATSAARYREASLLYGQVGHLRREAVAWGSLGVSLWNTGEWAAVLEAYTKALEVRRRLGDPVLVGRTLNALGSTYMRLSDYPAALRYYDEARAVRESLGNAGDLGTTLAYIGNVHYLMGNLVEAREEYRRSLEVFGPNAPPAQQLHAFSGLAVVHLALGEYRESLRLYRRALALAEGAGDVANANVCRQNLGQVLRYLGDAAGAVRELETARAAQEETGDDFNLSLTWNILGEVYAGQGDDARALRSYQTAADLARSSGNPKVLGEAITNIALTYRRMDLPDRALENLVEARKVLEEAQSAADVATVISNTGHVHRALGHPDSALVFYREALERSRSLGLQGPAAGEHGNIGVVLDDLGRFDEALAEFRSGARLAEETGRNDFLWPCLLGMAHVYERTGDLDSARVYNARAIDVMEGLRGGVLSEETKASFLAARSYVYEAQVHVLAQLDPSREGAAQEALATAERGKAQALLDLLAEGNLEPGAGLDSSLVAEREATERAMNSLRYRLRVASEHATPPDTVRALKKRLSGLETQLAALRDRLRLADPRLGSMESGKSWSLPDVRRALLEDDRTVLLVYSLGDSASYAWRVTKSELEMRRLPSREWMAGRVEQLRSGLGNPEPSGDAAFLDAAAELYGAILGPFQETLRGARRVLVVPDGVLNRVPFETLIERRLDPPAPADRARFFADLPYAFREAEVCYGPSASVLAVLAASREEQERFDKDLLAVGDPVFTVDGGATGLAALPHTREEVQNIAALFPEERRTVLLGNDAAERLLSAPGYMSGYRVLHIATHGLMDERRPENSSLALSVPRDSTEDGYLQAREIFDLELHADLVVLSACETGLGKVMRGEGVLGLPRAFFHAGVPRVVVSLWSVNDRSTAELMTRFYGGLVDRGREPAQALAGAKRDLREDGEYTHPFYWAPFVLLGPP